MAEFDDLIGKPFQLGGRGPDSFDCYGLVREAYYREHGVLIPDYRSPSDQGRIAALMANQLVLWERTECAPGAVILFRVLGYGSHVGFIRPDNRFMHTWEASGGVVIERLDASWERRSLGCYRYIGN